MAAASPTSLSDDDALMTLLTDALRAGPASPEWSRALAMLRETNPAGGDEYQLLLNARQNLESGRRYKEIRGGPAFGRRVLDGVDAISNERGRRWSPLTLLIGFGVLCVVAAAVGVGAWLVEGGGRSSENLAGIYLNTVAAGATFDGPLPPGWQPIGAMMVDPTKQLQPIVDVIPSSTQPRRHDFVGGGYATVTGLPADAPMAVEAVFTFDHVSDDLVPELFVTDDPHFDSGRATSPHELAWLVRDGQMKVALPDGKFGGVAVKVPEHSRESIRIVVGTSTVRVVANDQVLYEGSSHLGAGPRFAGVRLLRHGNAPADVHVVSIQVLQS